MTVRKVHTAGQMFDVSGTGYEPHGQFFYNGGSTQPPEALRQLLRGAALASDAHIVHNETENRWHVKGDPTEGALVVAAAKAGMAKAELDRTYPRLDEIPFTSETKRMTTLHQMPEGVMAFSKGAPEIILEDCTQQMTADGVRPLDAADRARLLETAQEMAGQALRVLAVAAKPETIIGQAEKGMTLSLIHI